MSNVREDFVLTTVDNPWNPFTQWDEWFAYDTIKGYNTSGLLDRFTVTSNDLSEPDNQQAILEGMKAIVSINPFGLHYILSSKDQFIPYDERYNKNEK